MANRIRNERLEIKLTKKIFFLRRKENFYKVQKYKCVLSDRTEKEIYQSRFRSFSGFIRLTFQCQATISIRLQRSKSDRYHL